VGLGMEVAFAFLEAGEEEQAHSLMFADKDARLDAGSRYRVRAASGQLRYHQWLHAWLDNEHRDPKCKVPGTAAAFSMSLRASHTLCRARYSEAIVLCGLAMPPHPYCCSLATSSRCTLRPSIRDQSPWQ